MADDQVRIVVGELTRFTERMMRAIPLEVTAELIQGTPRDTSWARANWVPRIGDPYVGPQVGNPGPGDVASAGARQSAGQASLTGYRLGPAIFVSNGVPYIGKLNEGSSQQAPRGFVQDRLLAGVRKVERAFS